MFVDFSKAFDVILWDFIDTALEIFGVGENTKLWIHILQKEAVSYI